MNTRDKFMQRMEGIAERRQVDFVVDYGFAGTGVAMFQHKGEFKPLVSFKFDFQTEYASFEGVPNPTRATHPDPLNWPEVKADQLDEFVHAVQIALTEVGITQRSEPR